MLSDFYTSLSTHGMEASFDEAGRNFRYSRAFVRHVTDYSCGRHESRVVASIFSTRSRIFS